MDLKLKSKKNGESYHIEGFGEKSKFIKDGNKFLESITLRSLSSCTVKSYGYDLIVIYRWIKQSIISFKNFTEEDLFCFIKSLKSNNRAAKTINRQLNTL